MWPIYHNPPVSSEIERLTVEILNKIPGGRYHPCNTVDHKSVSQGRGRYCHLTRVSTVAAVAPALPRVGRQ